MMKNILNRLSYKIPSLRPGDIVIIISYLGMTAASLIFLKNFTLDAFRTAVAPLSTQFWNNRVKIA
jgi:hypothetical protein